MKSRSSKTKPCLSWPRTNVGALIGTLAILMASGCNRDQATKTPEPTAPTNSKEHTAALPQSSPVASQTKLPDRPRVAVGDDPAVSLVQVADQARAAIERYDSVRRLVYPVGWNRKRTSVLAVRSAIEPSDAPADQQAAASPVQGVVRLTVQDRYSPIYATQEQAAADEELLPRAPMPKREEMLNDRTNPELESVELVVHYEARDGHWVRTGWEGPGKTTRGAEWLDQIGAP